MAYDGIIKIAKKRNEDNTDLGLGLASLGGAGLIGYKSITPTLGIEDVYHTTAKENVENILKEGLDPLRGGTKGGVTSNIVKDPNFLKRLKNKVYITKSKEVARLYEDAMKGEILKGGVPSKYLQKMRIDPEWLPANFLIGVGRTIKGDNFDIKDFEDATKTPELYEKADRIINSIKNRGKGVPIEDIRLRKKFLDSFFKETPSWIRSSVLQEAMQHGGERGLYDTEKIPAHVFGKGLKNKMLRTKDYIKGVPFHVKNNPKRFLTGVGGLGLAAALSGLGINLLGDD